MKLFTKEQYDQLVNNGHSNQKRRRSGSKEIDFMPVVKLFTPDAGATWLLSEILPDEDGLAFGLCDLGLGSPELGYVSLEELGKVRGRMGLPVERDLYFTPDKTLSIYTEEARYSGRITA